MAAQIYSLQHHHHMDDYINQLPIDLRFAVLCNELQIIPSVSQLLITGTEQHLFIKQQQSVTVSNSSY